MATIKHQTPDEPPHLTRDEVRAACDAFKAALGGVEQMIAAYREMVERFKASGTFEVDDEARAKLDALESDDAAFATMDRLDKIRRQGGAR